MNLDKRGWWGGGLLAVIAIVVVVGGWMYRQWGGGESIAFSSSALAAAPTAGSSKATTPAPTLEIVAGSRDAPAATPTPTPAPTPVPKLMVHVTGAVKHPGVYELAAGARIQQAIHAAGGFLTDADEDALNLADYARDADKYAVPRKSAKPDAILAAPPAPIVHSDRIPATLAVASLAPGRVLGKKSVASAPAKGDATQSAAHPAKFKNPGDGTVNLNTADATELQRLPGVGPAMAERILDFRKEHGKFDDISQMQDVKGIGPKKFEKMQGFLRVSP